jgi:hypothetical protein
MNTRNTSCTTTGLAVGDNVANRIKTQVTDEANAASAGTKATASSADLSPMGEASQPTPIVIKPVDRRTIQGSYPGDSRSQAAPVVMPNQPNPREAVGQAPFGKNTPSGPAPITTVDSENVGG